MSIRRKLGLSQIALEKNLTKSRAKHGTQNGILSVLDRVAGEFPQHLASYEAKSKLYEELAEILYNSEA